MRILPSCSHVSTTVWLNQLNSNEMIGEKARQKLHKNAACSFKQILEAAPYNTATVCHLSLISQTIQVR